MALGPISDAAEFPVLPDVDVVAPCCPDCSCDIIYNVHKNKYIKYISKVVSYIEIAKTTENIFTHVLPALLLKIIILLS